jgi:hypothetical protein
VRLRPHSLLFYLEVIRLEHVEHFKNVVALQRLGYHGDLTLNLLPGGDGNN